MAEFEEGYCTGCGVKVKKWGHRPYCWRLVTMMLDIEPSVQVINRCIDEMKKNWKIRKHFLCDPQHIYYRERIIEELMSNKQIEVHRG